MKTITSVIGQSLEFAHIIYDKPQYLNISRHSHNDYELLYFVKGNATYTIEDRSYELKRNSLIIIRPKLSHFITFNSPDRYERFTLNFNGSILPEKLRQLPDSLEVLNLAENNIIGDCFRRMDYYVENVSEEFVEDVLSGLIKEIFYNIKISSDALSALPVNSNQHISKALEYINANLFSIKSIQEVCDALFLSREYFFTLFKEELHVTPKHYILEKRMLYAHEQILLGKKMSEVAKNSGFSCYSSFYRNYVKFFGSNDRRSET